MAIIGGAGNPVGGSFTGPAEALEIVGDHAYAYSGAVAVSGGSSADTTCLKFTSGNFYSVVKVAWFSGQRGNAGRFVDVLFNNTTVYKGEYDDVPTGRDPIKLVIPPYTQFEFKWGCSSSTEVTVVIAGRIYRTRD